MESHDFVEVIYEQGPLRVIKIGWWRQIRNIFNNESEWIWDGPPQRRKAIKIGD